MVYIVQEDVPSESPVKYFVQVQCYQSEKPTILPSQLHQIISSSSSSSPASRSSSPVSSSTPETEPLHRIQTPSTRPPFPFFCLLLPPSCNPESPKKSSSIPSITFPQFCLGVQEG